MKIVFLTAIVFLSCSVSKDAKIAALRELGVVLTSDFDLIQEHSSSSLSDLVYQFEIQISNRDARKIYNDFSHKDFFINQLKQHPGQQIFKLLKSENSIAEISYKIESGIAYEHYRKRKGYAYRHHTIEIDTLNNILKYTLSEN